MADADIVFRLHDDVPFEKGAVLPLNYLTMHFALLRRAELKRGATVLVHGAAATASVGSPTVEV